MKLTLKRKPLSWPIVLRDGEPTGYYLAEGGYQGTPDDRLGRWYIGHDGVPMRRWGAGYGTQKDALERIAEWLEERDNKDRMRQAG